MNPNKLDIKITLGNQSKCLSVDLPEKSYPECRLTATEIRECVQASLDIKRKRVQYLEAEVENLKRVNKNCEDANRWQATELGKAHDRCVKLTAECADALGALTHKKSECETLRGQLVEARQQRDNFQVESCIAAKQRDEVSAELRTLRERAAQIPEDTRLLRGLLGYCWIQKCFGGPKVCFPDSLNVLSDLNSEIFSAMRRFNLIP